MIEDNCKCDCHKEYDIVYCCAICGCEEEST